MPLLLTHFQSQDVEKSVDTIPFLPFRSCSSNITSSIVGISFRSACFISFSIYGRKPQERATQILWNSYTSVGEE